MIFFCLCNFFWNQECLCIQSKRGINSICIIHLIKSLKLPQRLAYFVINRSQWVSFWVQNCNVTPPFVMLLLMWSKLACSLLKDPFLSGLRLAEVCWRSWHGRCQNTDHIPWPRPRPYCGQNDQHCHQRRHLGGLTELPSGHKLDASSGEDLWRGDCSWQHQHQIQVRCYPTSACLWAPAGAPNMLVAGKAKMNMTEFCP